MISRIVLILASVAGRRRLRRDVGNRRAPDGGRRLLSPGLRGRAHRRGRPSPSRTSRRRGVRAARSRAGSAGPSRAFVRADVVLYLGHGFQPAVTTAVEQAQGETVDVLAGPARCAAGRPARLARPGPVRADSRADRRRAARARTGRPAHRRPAQARPRISPRACALRAARDRDEPRGIRLPRQPLRPQAGRDHRSHARGRAHARRTWSMSSRSCGERMRRPSSSRRSSRRGWPSTVAREVGARTGVLDPIEGLTPAEKRGATYLSVMRRNLAHCGRRSDAAKRSTRARLVRVRPRAACPT